MVKLEIELNDELHSKLESVASKMALSPSEMAKFILAQQLADKSIDWMALVNRARTAIARMTQEAKK